MEHFGSAEMRVIDAYLIKICSASIVLIEVVVDFFPYCHFFLRNHWINLREA